MPKKIPDGWHRYSRIEPQKVHEEFKREAKLRGGDIDPHQAAAKWLYWRLPAEMRERAMFAIQDELDPEALALLEQQMAQFRAGWRSAIAALSSGPPQKTGKPKRQSRRRP